jgi:hypothetical protein
MISLQISGNHSQLSLYQFRQESFDFFFPGSLTFSSDSILKMNDCSFASTTLFLLDFAVTLPPFSEIRTERLKNQQQQRLCSISNPRQIGLGLDWYTCAASDWH